MVSSMILSILPSTMSSMMKVRSTLPLDSSICPSFTSRPIVLSRRSSCSSKTCSNYLENLLWNDQDLSALKVDLVEPAGDLVGRLEVRLDVHPVVLQRDFTHLVVRMTMVAEVAKMMMTVVMIMVLTVLKWINVFTTSQTQSRYHHKWAKWSAHLARVDVCQELVDFNERFLLLRVFDLVGDAKVDSESKIPERGKVKVTSR